MVHFLFLTLYIFFFKSAWDGIRTRDNQLSTPAPYQLGQETSLIDASAIDILSGGEPARRCSAGFEKCRDLKYLRPELAALL